MVKHLSAGQKQKIETILIERISAAWNDCIYTDILTEAQRNDRNVLSDAAFFIEKVLERESATFGLRGMDG